MIQVLLWFVLIYQWSARRRSNGFSLSQETGTWQRQLYSISTQRISFCCIPAVFDYRFLTNVLQVSRATINALLGIDRRWKEVWNVETLSPEFLFTISCCAVHHYRSLLNLFDFFSNTISLVVVADVPASWHQLVWEVVVMLLLTEDRRLHICSTWFTCRPGWSLPH